MRASEDTQATFADGVKVAAFFLTNSCTLSGRVTDDWEATRNLRLRTAGLRSPFRRAPLRKKGDLYERQARGLELTLATYKPPEASYDFIVKSF